MRQIRYGVSKLTASLQSFSLVVMIVQNPESLISQQLELDIINGESFGIISQMVSWQFTKGRRSRTKVFKSIESNVTGYEKFMLMDS